ncbi:MAG: hypothetical protein WC724_00290 [Candidatus Paceibacterota bacterium]|jgi:hypothetical protein
MQDSQTVSGTKPATGKKAKPAFGRKKVTRVDLFFDKETPAPYQRPAVAYSPGFTARYMIPCRVGENGRINANLSELCGFLRNSNVSVIGKKKVVEIEAKRGRHMRRMKREVIDPGPDCEVVVFTNMTTPHCYALKSQVVSGL